MSTRLSPLDLGPFSRTDRIVVSSMCQCSADDGSMLRAATSIVVRVPGNVQTPEEAERLVADGHVDLGAIARAFIADPRWPWRARARRHAVRPAAVRAGAVWRLALIRSARRSRTTARVPRARA